MNKQIIATLLIAVVVIAGVGVLAFNSNDSYKEYTGTDFAGYEIQPVDNFDNGIVAVGQDSFRWVTYFGLADKCVMVDMNDKTNYMGKSFMYVGKTQALNNTLGKELKFTGTNCGITDNDAREILKLNPSIVVVPAEFETDYANLMESLRAGGLNIVHIGYIYTFLQEDTFEITPDLDKQISVLSKAFDMYKRGDQLRKAINDTVKDITTIANEVAEKDRTYGYIGSLAYNGAHGADSSITYFIPFELAGIKNILASQKVNYEGSGVSTYNVKTIGNEVKDKDVILFLDCTGIFQCTDQTSASILKLSWAKAYVAYPYIWTGINYESVLICAYQMLHDAYGVIDDAELEKKINKVYDLFLGDHMSNRSETAAGYDAPEKATSIYDDLSNMYKSRRGNPAHGEIVIDKNTGTITSFQ